MRTERAGEPRRRSPRSVGHGNPKTVAVTRAGQPALPATEQTIAAAGCNGCNGCNGIPQPHHCCFNCLWASSLLVGHCGWAIPRCSLLVARDRLPIADGVAGIPSRALQ